MAYLPSELLSHQQKVCRLYKRAARCIEDWIHKTPDRRYEAALLRERFDKNKDIKDFKYAKYLLEEGEKELFSKIHYQPISFPDSPTGVAYDRKSYVPDYVLDYWHPLEKAMYPKYFARREQMKDEYMKWYFETYPEEKKKIDDH
ncbi:PREDICTED: NADH dehydrogenase [ubiquinone] 1 beta subcomplex subunit 9 [Cyphomyrmex costatus]|uniref:NADH dehydrogenase [ubiquinone] 1 beta subcomplex subunit 9 n=1 Tax=Cyphomyrmex costatus TaxID=456900 RepID=A0A195CGH4_9HYME|nr:PREDICTED: NADH dehydrogenase [ubiquinone] 1 beta subcomplex subunit 9 [Cyphomyrmex costatus]KYM99822.1 NADH dehydrogenase [ubiquinone] 1 beta subcomplex subunit 9 [Cyphomyrmex costatus]